MAEQPGNLPSPSELDDTRAALAPTLDATAAILPWVARPQPVRFPPELNSRWEEACGALAEAWNRRHQAGAGAARTPIFKMLAVALETADVDCLQLAEALASVADGLEDKAPSPRIAAAVASTLDALREPGGLENPLFGERARHFAQRLEQALAPSNKPGERSDVLDSLFVSDALERLERMHEALDVLPVDIYALKEESSELTQHAEQIDMWGIVHLSRQLQNFVLLMHEASEAGQDRARADIEQQLAAIGAALRAVDC